MRLGCCWGGMGFIKTKTPPTFWVGGVLKILVIRLEVSLPPKCRTFNDGAIQRAIRGNSHAQPHCVVDRQIADGNGLFHSGATLVNLVSKSTIIRRVLTNGPLPPIDEGLTGLTTE
jgi:hypothetical protein